MEYSTGRQYTRSRVVILLAVLLAVFALLTFFNLLANGKFRFQIAALSLPWKEAGRLTLSADAAASALYAPKLTARATEWGVELSWKAVAGAARYELMTWWDEETGWQPIGSYNLTGTTYEHTDVRTWRTYYFTIRAVNAAGETSGWWAKFPSVRVRPVVTVMATRKPRPALV